MSSAKPTVLSFTLISFILIALLILIQNCSFIHTLTPVERARFINLHNRLRRSPKIKPTPRPPIPFVRWSSRLANIASRYLRQCKSAHNPRRNAEYGSSVGENIYLEYGYTTGSSIDRGINWWFSEHAHYNYNTNTCAAGKVCGHYTQLIWAKSIWIGCAKHTCPNVQGVTGTSGKPVTLVLCNYAPAGNFIGRKPYTV